MRLKLGPELLTSIIEFKSGSNIVDVLDVELLHQFLSFIGFVDDTIVNEEIDPLSLVTDRIPQPF